jgi:hypothetical protein
MERDRFIKSVINEKPSSQESNKETSTPTNLNKPEPVTSSVKSATTTTTKEQKKSAQELMNNYFASTPSRKPSEQRARNTPKMTKFQGSNTPVRTRPVSLFVHSDSNKGSAASEVSGLALPTLGGSSNVRRSNSMRKLEGGMAGSVAGGQSLQERISNVLTSPSASSQNTSPSATTPGTSLPS